MAGATAVGRAARWLGPVVTHASWRAVLAPQASLWFQFDRPSGGLYNILWAVVFGFATINILSLGARRLEPKKYSLNVGEMMAVLVVIFSVFLLAWELLHLYRVFPIRLAPR